MTEERMMELFDETFHRIEMVLTDENLIYDLVSETWTLDSMDNKDVLNTEEVFRFLRTKYSSLNNFKDKVTDVFRNKIVTVEQALDFIPGELEEQFKNATPFTYKEAFHIENELFRNLVFTAIDITDMVYDMGHERIKTEGIQVKRKTFDIDGNFTGYVDYDNIYETHKVNGEKIGVDEPLYAVKCWCTSTNKEHWIWIEEQYKENPLEAIASTFRIHKNLIPHIKELKRQGDILLVEMKEDVKPEGEIVPLTKEQYFDLLTVET